jgi:signal transduction histidine kinase
MRRIHWIAIDCVVGAILALADGATAAANLHGRAKVPIVLLYMAVIFIPVALRRRAPVTAFGALLIVGVLLYRLPPSVSVGIFVPAAFVLYTVTVEGRKRTGAAALVLILVVMIFIGIADGSGAHGANAGTPIVPVALANVIAWMTGYSVRQRRLYVVTLQQQAASSAVAMERLRIARELHDVVAHSMSVIAVQAGYGQYVIDASPDDAKNALGAIQATSRDALEEMRRMLGVLRQQDVTPDPGNAGPGPGQAPADGDAGARQAPLAPAPGLAGLERLIERTGGAGVRVSLEVAGRPRPAPAGVDLSAYRIIQEALTNVVRHAGTGAACMVSLGYTDSDLVIRVTDDGGLPVTLPSVSVSATGTGHGIIGMRERVHLCGGRFDAGPRPAGGFQVTAALPLPPAAFFAPAGPGADGASRAEATNGADATSPVNGTSRTEGGSILTETTIRTNGASRPGDVPRTEPADRAEAAGIRTDGADAAPLPADTRPPGPRAPADGRTRDGAHAGDDTQAGDGGQAGDDTHAVTGAVTGNGGGRG